MQTFDEAAVQRVIEGARQLDIQLQPGAATLLVTLLEQVLAANERFNLTAVKDPYEAIDVHILDSLAGLRVLDRLSPVSPLVDIGTGAGFPGLVLACARSGWRFVLVDATRKKARFVQQMAALLTLDTVAVIWDRVENMGRKESFRERFQVALARAVAPLAVLVELALPLVTVGGAMLAYKGPNVAEELEQAENALEILGGEVVGLECYDIPFRGRRRHLVLIRKTAPTPPEFPRRPGIPAKRPLV